MPALIMGISTKLLPIFCFLLSLQLIASHREHPLARIAIHNTVLAFDENAYINATPSFLGGNGQNQEWVTLEYSVSNPSIDDWIGVFSPANFSQSTNCVSENPRMFPPLLCTAPIKYQFANYSSLDYKDTGKGSLNLQLINQRFDFSFVLFTGGLLTPKLVAVSNTVAFANPNEPLYPRLAQGKTWDEMTVTWTSGYDISEAEPFVEWGPQGGQQMRSPAGTLTFDVSSMCGAPARTVGWRDPGYIHTSFLKELWPNSVYTYKVGHRLFNGTYIWGRLNQFKSSPYPGQNSLQRVVIFGDMGKDEADGSNEYNNFQPGSLNTTKQLIRDLKDIDIVFHIGDICYANGYISQWDQFTAQIEPIASTIPYMVASGNHERDWPGTGSFYGNMDSGGECGVLVQTMFYAPTENREKFWYSDYGFVSGSAIQSASNSSNPPLADWIGCGSAPSGCGCEKPNPSLADWMWIYPKSAPIRSVNTAISGTYSTDYGMFRFCIADTEHDWREGSEQYKFIEHCLASTDRQKQPWLIFLAHRVLGYSSCSYYFDQGSSEEPMGRESLQKLWQKYKVDIAIFGHVHNYERTCPVYQNICTNKEKNLYKGALNGTIHVVAGGAGASVLDSAFAPIQPSWSLFRDFDHGFVKLTAFDHSNLLFEYKKSRDGKVYDSFRISRDYRDILACTVDSCPTITLAS